METADRINEILGIKESYKASEKLMELVYDKKKREKVYKEMLGLFSYDIDYDWFHEYFMNEQADRKKLKQDFTPDCISDLVSRILEDDVGGVYEPAAGSGGMLIRKWLSDRNNYSLFKYKPSNHYYVAEEMSDRALPFLIFNMAVRGMNGEVRHIDTLTRECKGVFFLQNVKDDYLSYSDINIMPYNETVEKICNVKFGDFRYKDHKDTTIEKSSQMLGVDINNLIKRSDEE